MQHSFDLKGVCPNRLQFDLVDGKIHNAAFSKGCDGNLQGICSLIEGMDASDVIPKLQNIRCGSKDTSCPAVLAACLQETLANKG